MVRRSVGITFLILVLLSAFVRCTKDEQKPWLYIGPEGGRLYSPDGNLRIDIPRGALPSKMRFTVEELPPVTSAQIGKVWRVKPGIAFAPGAKADVFIRYASLLPDDTEEEFDLVPILVRGDQIEPLAPFELNLDSKTIRAKTTLLSGFALLDWGCSKSCRKRSVCGMQSSSAETLCKQTCIEAVQSNDPTESWIERWCEISEPCQTLPCCADNSLPQCSADGDIEPDEEPEPEPDQDLTDPEPDLQEDTDPEPDELEPEPDPEPDIEREFLQARRCFEDSDCRTEEGETCFQDQNLCYILPEQRVRRYSLTEYGYTSVLGDPDISCIEEGFTATEGPTHTKVTVQLKILGYETSPAGATITVLEQDTWAEGSWSPLGQTETDETGIATFPLLPTNELLVFVVQRSSGTVEDRLYPSATENVFIPADAAQNAPPETGVQITVYSASAKTVYEYARYASVQGGLMPNGGSVWIVLRDCRGYFLANAAGHFWENEARGILYLSRELEPMPYAIATDASGHAIFFDLPESTQQVRFAGRTGEENQPTVIAREPVVIKASFMVFVELNRNGWLLDR